MKENNYFAIGEFSVVSLLTYHFNSCLEVIIKDKKYISKLSKFNIRIKVDKKYIDKLVKKEDIYMIAKFKPYINLLDKKKTHILIYNLNDEGEIGTIIRTTVAFNYFDIALINCNIDIFSSKLIRSSTGAFFTTNIKQYKDKEEYLKEYKNSFFIEFKNDNKFPLSLTVANTLYKRYAASIS